MSIRKRARNWLAQHENWFTALWHLHLVRNEPPPQDAEPRNEAAGRDMARAAFRKAIESGRSPGAAALLAELERGWAREPWQKPRYTPARARIARDTGEEN